MLHLNYVHLREIKTRRVKLVSEAGSVVLGSMVHLECVDQSKNTPKFYATLTRNIFKKKRVFTKQWSKPRSYVIVSEHPMVYALYKCVNPWCIWWARRGIHGRAIGRPGDTRIKDVLRDGRLADGYKHAYVYIYIYFICVCVQTYVCVFVRFICIYTH